MLIFRGVVSIFQRFCASIPPLFVCFVRFFSILKPDATGIGLQFGTHLDERKTIGLGKKVHLKRWLLVGGIHQTCH